MDVSPSIIFISGHGDIPVTVGAMKAGAIDFLVKPVDDTVLLDAIEVALRHASDARASRIERDSIQNRFDRLTAREREVLALVVKGHANKLVAYELRVAEKTIKVHRGRVMQKMQARSLAELVRILDKADVFHTIPSVLARAECSRVHHERRSFARLSDQGPIGAASYLS